MYYNHVSDDDDYEYDFSVIIAFVVDICITSLTTVMRGACSVFLPLSNVGIIVITATIIEITILAVIVTVIKFYFSSLVLLLALLFTSLLSILFVL